jgi:outer membrane protein assembly factor BamA
VLKYFNLFVCFFILNQIAYPQIVGNIDVYPPGHNEFTSSYNKETIFIKQIDVLGNKRTKNFIITREMTFKQFDSIPPGQLPELLLRSKNNIYNLGLFNIVNISYYFEENNLFLQVFVIERWYIWPIPYVQIADPNFNTWWETKELDRLNIGINTRVYNFRGRNETLRLKMQIGYTNRFALRYEVPFIDKRQKLGMGIYGIYSNNKEVVTGTTNNKRNLLFVNDRYIREEYQAGINFTHRKRLYNTHSLGLKYNYITTDDTLIKITPDYLPKARNYSAYLNIEYLFVRDKRDIRFYPLQGHYIDVDIEKVGLGILKNSPDFLSFTASARFYHKMKDRWYWATTAKTKWVNTYNQPYYLQQGLGNANLRTEYDILRGYEYFIIDGQQWWFHKSAIKYNLLKPTVVNLDDFQVPKNAKKLFYAWFLTAFFDHGYVKDQITSFKNPLANQYLYSYGLGLEMMGSFDSVMRIEYSFNSTGKGGIFLNFIAPI